MPNSLFCSVKFELGSLRVLTFFITLWSMSINVIYEDNHILVVNKRSGELVQPDPSGEPALEQAVAQYLKVKGDKPGDAFVGVVHRVDRPVSGAVMFAKTSKALVRLNEMIKERKIKKTYWAVIENRPEKESDRLVHYILRNPKTNKSVAHPKMVEKAQEAILEYRLLSASDRYYLLEIELITGRHHQIRAQLSAIGCHIKGDLKYGAKRSNPDGSISLHSRSLRFIHPVTKEEIFIIAPAPEDSLWSYFEKSINQ